MASLSNKLWTCLTCLCVLASCKGTNDVPEQPIAEDLCSASAALVPPTSTSFAGATIWRVPVRATDGCIDQRLDTHYVYRNRLLAAKGRLLVFLPGTGALPRDYRFILAEGAQQGYHALGLCYTNETAVGDLCNASQPSSLSCSGDVRRERLEGVDLSPLVNVNRANSIENRLIKALKLMQQISPADNWGQFVAGDSIHWRNVVVAGHSQGGGFAGYIGKNRRVFRVGMFAGPGDFVNIVGQYSTWLTTGSSKTAASSFYGMTSPLDELAPYSILQGAWALLGLGAATDVTDVDVVPSPYANRRILTSNAAPRNPSVVIGPYHNMPVVDVNTPLVNPTLGPATFAPVWRYMLFP